MRPDLIEAFRAAVEKAGLNLIIDPEDCWADAQDRAGRGVAIITSHPVSMDANPLKEKWPGRALFARAHVKARRPLRLGIPYCNASDERDAEEEAAAMLKHLLELGDPAFALGDWNLVQEQRPFASLLGKGVWRAADDVAPHEVQHTGPARPIDFGLGTSDAPPSLARGQVAGVADHDLIYYDLELGAVGDVLRRPPHKPLGKEEVSDALWEQRLEPRREEMAAAEEKGDAATTLCLLLDTAEEALTGVDLAGRPGLPRRTKPRRPVRKPLASTRSDKLQSLMESSCAG